MKRSQVNWDEIRSRIQANENALEEALSRSPARMNMVFRQRAMDLAKQRAQDEPGSAGIPALIIRLDRERYAVELRELAEVLAFRDCTRVPGTPAKFLGVISLRGELRPVIDLGLLLSGKASGESGFILVLRRALGFKVDSIDELREIRTAELAPGVPGSYTRGLISETLKLLDVEAILSAVVAPTGS